jgi:hypothetical protein
MLLAVAYFELQTKFLMQGDWHVLFAYIPVLILTAFLGYRLANWYEPLGNEPIILELIFAPLVIILISTFGAGCVWAVFLLVTDTGHPFGITDFWLILVTGISAALVFITHTWPFLLVGGACASLLTRMVAQKTLINSSIIS